MTNQVHNILQRKILKKLFEGIIVYLDFSYDRNVKDEETTDQKVRGL